MTEKQPNHSIFESHTVRNNRTVADLGPIANDKITLPKRKPLWLKLLLSFIVLMIIGLTVTVLVKANYLSSQIFIGQQSNFFKRFTNIIESKTGLLSLQGEKQGQVNLLLLGIGGKGHDGPYLSDTIIVTQLNVNARTITMTSIPRDYLVNLGTKLGYRKINAAFAETYEATKDYNEAGKAAIKAAQEISGLTIPYFAVVDFAGFEQAIDLVGGVEVEVERTFTDYTYPDSKLGYMPAVTFKKGVQTLDGKRSLIFARSRHAAGPEGSDFARSQRQQKIIQALKAKLISLNIITDANTVNKLTEVVSGHFHTNLNEGELFHLYDLVKQYGPSQSFSLSLDPATGLVCDGKQESTGAYIIEPCSGISKSDIQEYFKDSAVIGQMTKEKTVVYLADSNKSKARYNKTKKFLEAKGMTVFPLSYQGESLSRSVVYEVHSKPASLSYIKQTLNVNQINIPPPNLDLSSEKADLILILGGEDGVTSNSENEY